MRKAKEIGFRPSNFLRGLRGGCPGQPSRQTRSLCKGAGDLRVRPGGAAEAGGSQREAALAQKPLRRRGARTEGPTWTCAETVGEFTCDFLPSSSPPRPWGGDDRRGFCWPPCDQKHGTDCRAEVVGGHPAGSHGAWEEAGALRQLPTPAPHPMPQTEPLTRVRNPGPQAQTSDVHAGLQRQVLVESSSPSEGAAGGKVSNLPAPAARQLCVGLRKIKYRVGFEYSHKRMQILLLLLPTIIITALITM